MYTHKKDTTPLHTTTPTQNNTPTQVTTNQPTITNKQEELALCQVICIQTYVQVYVRVCVCMYVHVCVCVCAFWCARMQVCEGMCFSVYVCVHACTRVSTFSIFLSAHWEPFQWQTHYCLLKPCASPSLIYYLHNDTEYIFLVHFIQQLKPQMSREFSD